MELKKVIPKSYVDRVLNTALQLPSKSFEHFTIQLFVPQLNQTEPDEAEQHDRKLKRPKASRIVQHYATTVHLATELAFDQLFVASVHTRILML